jgi:methylated-DNA-[protein]-cysteine S-methyltransferase
MTTFGFNTLLTNAYIMTASETHHLLRSTPFGPAALVWASSSSGPKVLRIFLPNPKREAIELVQKHFPHSRMLASKAIQELAERIEAFMRGEDIRFSLHMISIELCPPFQKQVLEAEYKIPRGRISTYGRIAAHIGTPKGARAVGTALANNPFPIIIPCHRAIRSDYTLGGFQGGLQMKRALLAQEGITFSDEGKIISRPLHY